MGKITGFIEIERQDRPYVPVAERRAKSEGREPTFAELVGTTSG